MVKRMGLSSRLGKSRVLLWPTAREVLFQPGLYDLHDRHVVSVEAYNTVRMRLV